MVAGLEHWRQFTSPSTITRFPPHHIHDVDHIHIIAMLLPPVYPLVHTRTGDSSGRC